MSNDYKTKQKELKEKRRRVWSTGTMALKPGETIVFPATKTRYQRQADGSLRRI